ncbi:Polycystin domain [Popillia japonica]|uniref:Polycystin domain n=1 Tax=Popillia japonica TaxID=7064 RepID=A0AAW1MDZ0_POPJA
MTTEMAEDFDREYYLSTTARESIIFTVFLINLSIAALGMVYPAMFFMTRLFKQEFVETYFESSGNKIKFSQIRSAGDFWAFAENRFVSGLYWDYWYDEATAIKETGPHDKGILFENKLLGVPRIRQLKRTFLECFSGFSESSKDKAPFGPGTGTAWTYSPITVSMSTTGKVARYDTSGYYEKLSKNSNETLKILKYLKQNLWITRGTRAVFIDFTTYNPNVNLFCVVKLMFEFPPTGGVIPTAYFYTLKLLRYATRFDYVILACEILHFCFAIFYCAEEIREIMFDKWRYFKRFWSYIDQAIIWTSFLYSGMSIYKFIIVVKVLMAVEQQPNEYFGFFRFGLWEIDTRNYQAVTLFLVYMKIFKYLSFNKTMGQLNNTLRKCAKDVLSFSVMFMLIFVSFAQLGYLIFGSQVAEFSAFGTAMFTLLRTILGDFDYSEIEKAHRILAPLYFLLFIFLVFFVLLNMFLAIINDTYSEVKTEMAIAPDQMQMAEFCKRGYYNFMRKCGCGKLVHPVKVMQNEYNATMEQIRGALKKCGFSDMDIDMFFARYNIDPTAAVDEADVSKLVQDLLGKPEEGVARPQGGTHHTADGVPLVAIEDFVAQQERLDNIEKVMAQIAEKLDALLQKLKKLEGSKT